MENDKNQILYGWDVGSDLSVNATSNGHWVFTNALRQSVEVKYTMSDQTSGMAADKGKHELSEREKWELEMKEIVKQSRLIIPCDSYTNYYVRELEVDRKSLKSYDGQNYRFYTSTIDFKPGVNLLFGGNGQGKSSLIEYLKTLCGVKQPMGKEKGIFKYSRLTKTNELVKVYTFINRENNASYFDGDTYDQDFYTFNLVRKWQAGSRSEGQSVIQSIADFLYVLDGLDKDTKAIILMDEIDSGLDACMCKYLVSRLKKVIKDKPNLQMFIAFNQYEISKLDSKWINICTGLIEDCPKTYEEYYKRLSENKKRFKRKVDLEVRK